MIMLSSLTRRGPSAAVVCWKQQVLCQRTKSTVAAPMLQRTHHRPPRDDDTINTTRLMDPTSSLFWQPTSSQQQHTTGIIINQPPIITNIRDLVPNVAKAVRERKELDIVPGSLEDPILALFRRTRLTPQEWSRFAFWDTSRPYTRNLIATDHHGFTLLLLCWNPQQESPIHDHPCDGCWLQVLQGEIQECRYTSTTTTKLECISDETFEQGQIAYITDNMGYHKIGNPTFRPSATLHIYAPPIHECKTWRLVEDGHVQCEQAISTHYSEYGFRVQQQQQQQTPAKR